MTTHVKVGGIWREVREIYVRVAGAWREVREVSVRHAGTWRSVFLGEIPTLDDVPASNLGFVVLPTSNRPRCAIRFRPDGTIQTANQNTGQALVWVTVGNWLNTGQAPDTPADWEIERPITSADSGGSWTGDGSGYLPLTQDRTYIWTKDNALLGSVQSVVTFRVRQVSNTSNVDSKGSTFTATVDQ